MKCSRALRQVLILIVVDNGLVLDLKKLVVDEHRSLNPYCSGQWTSTLDDQSCHYNCTYVLILIVVDNGLVQLKGFFLEDEDGKVLILIVVDNGLVRSVMVNEEVVPVES